jgi:nitrogenase molybdenum-cofactor synthesis protein NifE
VYATCIVGVIGDDVEAVCRQAEKNYHNRVIPVKAPGFSGTKSQGYKLACNAILQLLAPHQDQPKQKGINILGDFNLAGEIWMIQNYLTELGIPVISTLTGDSNYETLIRAPSAQLNIVQCAGSSMYLAQRMKEKMGIPFLRVSFFGIEDTTKSLLAIAMATGDNKIIERAKAFTKKQSTRARKAIAPYCEKLRGKRAAIYVGGGFKAISLIRQFREMGIETVVVGTQTGKSEDYAVIQELVKPGTVILDDTNPAELETFIRETHADLLVGGVKERPLAYKLGIAFCDHNHERKHALAGYEGVINFAKEINLSVNSPVWQAISSQPI